MLINIFATNFVQIIMYSRKVGVKRAWWIFLVFLARNFFEILLYLLVKFGLFLLGVLVFLVLTIIGILIILIIGGALTLIGFLIYILTPASAKPIVSVVITVIGVPSFAVLLFVVRFIILPIPVFFRLFSIHFLGSIDSSFDPFVRCSEEIEKGEDTEKYKKSMALVWMAIFSPLIPALLIIAALFAGGPTLAKTCFPKKEPPAAISAPESAEPAKEAKAIGEKQIKKILPLRNIKANYVKIYLKNGRSLEAEIVKEDPNAITFGMEGGTFTLSRESIERIEQKNK
ncbi:MAG: hypothetical protein A2Z72_01845 [Omnitrophica bacterium RBG_13_46_9]|nr:MAG: hypothetical protein A2Z72_01845 [Omnitrophica bacterium RBG_13_46_9]